MHDDRFILWIFSYEIFASFLTRPQLEGSHVERGWICERAFMYQWYRFGTGENVQKKEQFQALHAIMNELSVFQFDSSPYRFPWFGATFKTKERLTRRLLHQHFSRFLRLLSSCINLTGMRTNASSHKHKVTYGTQVWSFTLSHSHLFQMLHLSRDFEAPKLL